MITKHTYPLGAGLLQWGRDVSIPEMLFINLFPTFPHRLQWGRDVSIPEILTFFGLLLLLLLASMGPGCFYPGNAVTKSMNELFLEASMGPGCFYPGNGGGVGDRRRGRGLQWGRDVSIPEMCPCFCASELLYGFNGAGMFLSRK